MSDNEKDDRVDDFQDIDLDEAVDESKTSKDTGSREEITKPVNHRSETSNSMTSQLEENFQKIIGDLDSRDNSEDKNESKSNLGENNNKSTPEVEESFVEIPIKNEKEQRESLNDLAKELKDIFIDKNSAIKDSIGEDNAKRFEKAFSQMEKDVKKADMIEAKQEIMMNFLNKTENSLEKIEDPQQQGKVSKLLSVVKAAAKVVGTLGKSKSARLEYAAAKFAVSDQAKNVNSIKDKVSEYKDKPQLKKESQGHSR